MAHYFDDTFTWIGDIPDEAERSIALTALTALAPLYTFTWEHDTLIATPNTAFGAITETEPGYEIPTRVQWFTHYRHMVHESALAITATAKENPEDPTRQSLHTQHRNLLPGILDVFRVYGTFPIRNKNTRELYSAVYIDQDITEHDIGELFQTIYDAYDKYDQQLATEHTD